MPDPYAAYGGAVASGGSADPYAAYGGSAVASPSSAQPEKPGFFQSLADASGLSSAAHAIAHPIDTIESLPSTIKNIVTSTAQNTSSEQKAEKDAFNQGQYGAAASHAVLSVPILGSVLKSSMNQTDGNSTQNTYGQNLKALITSPGAMGTLTGAAAAPVLGRGVAEVAQVVVPAIKTAANATGAAAEDAGVGLMNKTVGTLKNDFKRGANPARGYFDAGNGTSLSMGSIADKAATSLDTVGIALGNAYQTATDKGVLIPFDDVAAKMAAPLQKALDLETGPGGTGNTATIKNYIDQFEPAFAKAQEQGGFTPSELFNIKRQIAQNTNWSDPAQFNLKTVRQQQVGALSGILSDAIPETADLNQNYQDLTKLVNRAQERSNTGSRPLTDHIYKAGATTAGAMAGALDGHALLGAAAGAALDSVPLKTAIATGLVRGGRALQSFASPSDSAAAIGESSNDLAGNSTAAKGSNPQSPSPITDGSTTGATAWAYTGAQKLAAHLEDNPDSGVTASDISTLAKTPQGTRLLINASDLTPNSTAMKNLVKQIKTTLGATQ